MQSLLMRPARGPWPAILSCAAFACLLYGAKLWLIAAYANATPFWDQWGAEAEFLYKPWLEGALRWRDLFSVHNEHRIAASRMLSLALLWANGLWNPLLQMVVGAALHVAAVLLAAWLLARATRRSALPALLAFALVVFAVPHAWENTLAAFQSAFHFLVLFSVASLWLASTARPLSARWMLGIGLAAASYASLASGALTFVAIAGVAALQWLAASPREPRAAGAFAAASLVFLLFYALTPVRDYGAIVPGELYRGFVATLGWPLPSHELSALARNLPAAVALTLLLRDRPAPGRPEWFLVALALWVSCQSAAIVFGRAAAPLTSRYLDVYALGLLLNLACIVWLFERVKTGWLLAAGAAWIVGVVVALGLHPARLAQELELKRRQGLTQEENTRAYLRTGDLGHLRDKPFLAIPFPKAERLARILDDGVVRAILPAHLQAPWPIALAKADPSGGFVEKGVPATVPTGEHWILGSYNASGNAALGELTISSPAMAIARRVTIPIAGHPREQGMALEVMQHGQTLDIAPTNPGEAWTHLVVATEPGPFAIRARDGSPRTWIAVGEPTLTGRWDGAVASMLAHHRLWLGAGAVLAALAAFSGALSRRAAR